MKSTAACTVTIHGVASILPELGAHRDSLVCPVDRRRIEAVVQPRLRKKIDRLGQLALLAFVPIERTIADVPRSRTGVFLGNDLAGWNYVYEQVGRMVETRDSEAIDPYVATAWFPAAAQGELTVAHGILGESKTFSAGCLSGGLAMEYSARVVAAGRLDIVLAGGVEAPDAPVVLRSLAASARITCEHPASEVAAVLAMGRPGRESLAEITISPARRSMEMALNDVTGRLDAAMRVRCLLPSVAPGNERWQRMRSSIETVLHERFGERLEVSRPSWSAMDLGSATFPMAVIDACRRFEERTQCLVIGTDFEGLFMAAVVIPTVEGGGQVDRIY